MTTTPNAPDHRSSQQRVLDSIAAKRVLRPRVDANGVPLPPEEQSAAWRKATAENK